MRAKLSMMRTIPWLMFVTACGVSHTRAFSITVTFRHGRLGMVRSDRTTTWSRMTTSDGGNGEPPVEEASASVDDETSLSAAFDDFQGSFVETVEEAIQDAADAAAELEATMEEEDDDDTVTDGTVTETSSPAEETLMQDDSVPVEETTETTAAVATNWSFLQSLGAITGRGEFAKPFQHKAARQVVEELEGTHIYTGSSTGTWELVYSDTQLFRSSPFFMAGRAVCQSEVDIQRFNWFCDMHRAALAISTIRNVRQIVSDSKLVSEFEVSAGAIPFLSDFTPFRYSGGLPVSITGAIVSTADIAVSKDNQRWELYMDTVSIRGSNIPLIRQILDRGVKLESRKLAKILEDNVSNYTTPKPVFRTTYLDDTFRISRDEDDHIFVYLKTSPSTEPTKYDRIDSDLGIAKLLEGFNDAVTRLYL